MSQKNLTLKVEADDAALRVDRFLADKFPQLSRAKWIELIEVGLVLVNGKTVKPSNKLQEGFEVLCPADVSEHEQKSFSFENVEFSGDVPDVIFEDEHIFVLSKSASIAVHPGAGLPLGETLLGWAILSGRVKSTEAWPQELLDENRPGVVHRLDKATSGLLVLAKNPAAHEHLAKQFKDHSAHRHYWAVVKAPLSFVNSDQLQGPVRRAAMTAGAKFAFKRHEDQSFTLVCFLERDPYDKTHYRVSTKGEGRKSVSHFVCTGQNDNYALLELKLDTGRTHQIRVHMQFLGHPIVGDETYGGGKSPRLMLHAHKLVLVHPVTQKEMTFKSVWPQSEIAWFEQQNLTLKEHSWAHGKN